MNANAENLAVSDATLYQLAFIATDVMTCIDEAILEKPLPTPLNELIGAIAGTLLLPAWLIKCAVMDLRR